MSGDARITRVFFGADGVESRRQVWTEGFVRTAWESVVLASGFVHVGEHRLPDGGRMVTACELMMGDES